MQADAVPVAGVDTAHDTQPKCIGMEALAWPDVLGWRLHAYAYH